VQGTIAPGLAPACAEAGLPAVPLDPFGRGPLARARVEGRWVVYSVGLDGTDEGGRVDNDYNRRKTGDLVHPPPRRGR
jgi:hypothetical protein